MIRHPPETPGSAQTIAFSELRVSSGRVLGRHDGVSRRNEGLGELTVLKILLCAQDREIEVRHFDPRHLVAGDRSTFRMGIGECVAEALAAWIGMALDNRHMPSRFTILRG